jgi:replicative DNA helicase
VPVESEESLVGCLLADPSTFVAIAESVNWRHFGDGKCKLIARAIWECVEDGLVISQANVIAKLQTIDPTCAALTTTPPWPCSPGP